MIRRHWVTAALAVSTAVVLAACSSASKRPDPTPLAEIAPLVNASQAWSAQVGSNITFPLVPMTVGGRVAVAGDGGQVVMLDAASGREIWRANAGADLTAGVGSDGQVTAVVTRNNDVVAFDAAGHELWRERVAAQVVTPPFVGGGRVFVNASDRSIQAYDARNGAGLWRQQQRSTDSLVLRQNGALTSFGNALLVGLSGNVYGANPDNGAALWGIPIGAARGTNEVERLSDVVGGIARSGNILCARAYQTAVACLQAGGPQLWSKPSVGSVGVAMDDQKVYSVESNDRVSALDVRNGSVLWTNDRLMYRYLTGPLVLGRSIAVGDFDGHVHLLSRDDGSLIGRFSTDGSAIAATPVAVGDTLVVTTRKGAVYGFRPN